MNRSRPGFEAAIESGDTLVIWKMDRAFRSLMHALETIERLETRAVEFRSLTDHIDTSTAMGRCMYQISNAFAELERNLISERTKAGLQAAKARGKALGRPPKLTPTQIDATRRKLSSNPERTITAEAKTLGISPRTLSRAIKR